MPIFTIGHSTHSLAEFVELLASHGVEVVADVRSTPYSRRVPQFNREPLSAWLRRHGFKYAHMPDEFGARRTDPALLDAQGRVNFDRVRATEEFRRGVERLERGVEQGRRIALMCAEADPFDCHRFSMISYQLVRKGLAVHHILRDGSVIENRDLEERLWRKQGIPLTQTDLFGGPAAAASPLEEAYRQLGRAVAYASHGDEE